MSEEIMKKARERMSKASALAKRLASLKKGKRICDIGLLIGVARDKASKDLSIEMGLASNGIKKAEEGILELTEEMMVRDDTLPLSDADVLATIRHATRKLGEASGSIESAETLPDTNYRAELLGEAGESIEDILKRLRGIIEANENSSIDADRVQIEETAENAVLTAKDAVEDAQDAQEDVRDVSPENRQKKVSRALGALSGAQQYLSYLAQKVRDVVSRRKLSRDAEMINEAIRALDPNNQNNPNIKAYTNRQLMDDYLAAFPPTNKDEPLESDKAMAYREKSIKGLEKSVKGRNPQEQKEGWNNYQSDRNRRFFALLRDLGEEAAQIKKRVKPSKEAWSTGRKSKKDRTNKEKTEKLLSELKDALKDPRQTKRMAHLLKAKGIIYDLLSLSSDSDVPVGVRKGGKKEVYNRSQQKREGQTDRGDYIPNSSL